MRTCLRAGPLPSLRAFRPFTAVPPRSPHARAVAVVSDGFASSRRRFAGAALLAAGLMFSGRPRGLAASAAQQSVEKVWNAGGFHQLLQSCVQDLARRRHTETRLTIRHRICGSLTLRLCRLWTGPGGTKLA